MINENNLTKYYNEIAQKLDEMIPGEWTRIVMYAEELGDVRSACFYFYTKDKNIHYSGDIPKEYNVSEDTFDTILEQLWAINKNLWLQFKNAGEDTWCTITFYLDSNWKFKTKFEYEMDIEIGDYERKIRWAYNELGVIPKSEYAKELLEEYLKGQKENL